MILEEDPAAFLHYADDGNRRLPRSSERLADETSLDAFVESHLDSLVEQGAECATCSWRQVCRGYFKWPDPGYSCGGVKQLFSIIEADIIWSCICLKIRAVTRSENRFFNNLLYWPHPTSPKFLIRGISKALRFREIRRHLGRRILNFKSPLLGSKGSRTEQLSPVSIVLDDVFLFVCLEGPQCFGHCANVKLALVNHKVIWIDVREPALS